MHFSSQTILALVPFFLTATAVPLEARQVVPESRNPAAAVLPILEGFSLATDIASTIKDMTDGKGDADKDESTPRNLGFVKEKSVEAVCISGEKPANPVWFRTTFRKMCEKVTGYDDDEAPTTGKHENMASIIEEHTASWGQTLKFEIAWQYNQNVPISSGKYKKFTPDLCKDLVNKVGDSCTPSDEDGEPQTQGAKPVVWNKEILMILDVTE